MVYRYMTKAKLVSVIQLGVFVFFTLTMTNLPIRVFTGLVALLLLKDTLKTFTMQMTVEADGLWIKDMFGKVKKVDFQALEFITITKKNKHWVALVSKDRIFYIRRYVSDTRGLLLALIEAVKKHKITIHDDINQRYGLDLKLNDQGKIIK